MRRFVTWLVAVVAALGIVAVSMSSGAGAGVAKAPSLVPRVKSVSPEHGPVGGGTLVTINGTNLFGATAVTFGGADATFVNRSSNRLQVLSPPGPAGPAVDIEVTTDAGTSAPISADLFTYVTTPAVQSITPAVGASHGGNLVAISGSDFVGVTAVAFGSAPATTFTVVSPNTITAVSPANPVSTVDVTVTGTDGTTPIDPADHFKYVAKVPVVSSVVFDVGNEAGGSNVTITGSGFTKDATVYFGTTPATNVTDVGASTITATSPAGTGIVDVTVSTDTGASVIHQPMDEFMYTATGP